jgi:hypothetical protein
MAALRHFDGDRYELYACVMMDDHVHVLIKPLGKHILQNIVHSWKSFTAHKFRRDYGREPGMWQEEYFDRIVRDEEEFLDKAQYILNNPLKMAGNGRVPVGMGQTGFNPAGRASRPPSLKPTTPVRGIMTSSSRTGSAQNHLRRLGSRDVSP